MINIQSLFSIKIFFLGVVSIILFGCSPVIKSTNEPNETLPENNVNNSCEERKDCTMVQDKLLLNLETCVPTDQLPNARYNQEGSQGLVGSFCDCQRGECVMQGGIPKEGGEAVDPMLFQGNCRYTGVQNEKLDFSVWKTHCASQLLPDFDTQYLIDAQEEKGWIFDFYFPILCKPCDPETTTDCSCPPATEYRMGKNAQAVLKEGYERLDTALFCSENPWWIKNNCEKYFYALKTSEETERKKNEEQYYCNADNQCLMMKKVLFGESYQGDLQTCIHEDQQGLDYMDIPEEERRAGGGCACVATMCDMVGSGYFGLSEEEKMAYKKEPCQQDDPVCGVNGKTYENTCQAVNINRIEVAYSGACQEAKIIQEEPINFDDLLKENQIQQVHSLEESQNIPAGTLRMGSFSNY